MGRRVTGTVDIRQAAAEDLPRLAPLVAEFRAALAGLKHAERLPNVQAAHTELAEYDQERFRVFVAETAMGNIVGYLVCRVDDTTVWAESLFVLPAHRRIGIASVLYAQAEHLAQQLGAKSVYNWVHPNNEAAIGFLKGCGYDVLNLIELRRAYPGERTESVVRVDTHEFNY